MSAENRRLKPPSKGKNRTKMYTETPIRKINSGLGRFFVPPAAFFTDLTAKLVRKMGPKKVAKTWFTTVTVFYYYYMNYYMN